MSGLGESFSSPRRIVGAERQAEALRLRKDGWSYDAIAKQLGYKNPSGASEAIRSAMQKLVLPAAEEYRALELERLDALWKAAWPYAQNGSAEHINAALRIMARRAALLGLDAPVKQELSGDNTLRVENVNDWRGTAAKPASGPAGDPATGAPDELAQCRPALEENDAGDGDSG